LATQVAVFSMMTRMSGGGWMMPMVRMWVAKRRRGLRLCAGRGRWRRRLLLLLAGAGADAAPSAVALRRGEGQDRVGHGSGDGDWPIGV
jgi:hypothetical protein